MKILIRALILAAVIVTAYVAGTWNGNRSIEGDARPPGKAVLYYQCPMHPGFKSDKPGIAPCCGMQMEPVYAGGSSSAAVSEPPLPSGTIRISPEKQQTIGLRTGLAAKNGPSRTMRVLGRISADETRVYRVRAAVKGWIRETYDNAVGSLVEKDQTLALFYTPELVGAEQSFFDSLSAIERFGATSKEVNTIRVTSYVRGWSPGDVLRNLGMSEVQLEELKKTRQAAPAIRIVAPGTGFVISRTIAPGLKVDEGEELYRIADLRRVWILADIFENEGRYLHPGTAATAFQPQLGRSFKATVSHILPLFDPATRTLKVRLEADNPGYVLRPDMFVDVEFPLNLPAALSVPTEAVLDTGMNKSVFVDRGNGFFERRLVETGWRLGGRVEITKGLTEGERIVVSGNFLVDSESRLQETAAAARSAASQDPAGSNPGTAAKVKDPVCGMEIEIGKAKGNSTYQGKTFYFCTDECKKSFDSNPQQYSTKAARAGAAITAQAGN